MCASLYKIMLIYSHLTLHLINDFPIAQKSPLHKQGTRFTRGSTLIIVSYHSNDDNVVNEPD